MPYVDIRIHRTGLPRDLARAYPSRTPPPMSTENVSNYLPKTLVKLIKLVYNNKCRAEHELKPYKEKPNSMNSNSNGKDTPSFEELLIGILVTSEFELGSIAVTKNAMNAVPAMEALHGLYRHSQGKWGNVPAEDAAENELSLREGFRLMSSYTTRGGVVYWIITEADRSVTTILLPEDY